MGGSTHLPRGKPENGSNCTLADAAIGTEAGSSTAVSGQIGMVTEIAELFE